MDFVRMGMSGLKITQITFGSALTIGTEHEEKDFAQKMIDTAWNLGIRSFDTSNNYGMGKAEYLLGMALKKYPREEYVIGTKGSWPIGESVYHRGLSRKHILWSIEKSLERLNLDYVDIYYAHRYDPDVSMQEIVRTFNYLINSGKIRYWATSEWPLEALIECHKVCDKLNLEKPILEQSIYSFALEKIKNNGIKDFCEVNKIGLLGFSPLCQGFLTGKYKNGIPKGSRIDKSNVIKYNKTINFYSQNKNRIDKFISICDKYNIKGSQLAILWCIRNKIYPVLGASTPEQLIETVNGLNIKISDKIWKELENI